MLFQMINKEKDVCQFIRLFVSFNMKAPENGTL
jgi:hypothetical protein